MSGKNVFYYLYYKCQAVHRKKPLFGALREQSHEMCARKGSDLCSGAPHGREQPSRLRPWPCLGVQLVRTTSSLNTGAAEKKTFPTGTCDPSWLCVVITAPCKPTVPIICRTQRLPYSHQDLLYSLRFPGVSSSPKTPPLWLRRNMRHPTESSQEYLRSGEPRQLQRKVDLLQW